MPTAQDVILQNSTNIVQNPSIVSYTDKSWARDYDPVINFNVFTTVDENSICHADFDKLLPRLDDDSIRLDEHAEFPNKRSWRLETEADIELWWHTETSNPVLSAWNRYPRIIQTSHTSPLSGANIPENIDCTYAMYVDNARVPVLIGEIKRNLINKREWQSGTLSEPQNRLSRELRGYADKYECPQIFCWDGETLLLLQFRAQYAAQIKDPNCQVDCWVIPRERSTCSLRYALHRFMVQGLRRCQSQIAEASLAVGGLTQFGREFYTGQPIWQLDGKIFRNHPLGYYRIADIHTGALGWKHGQDPSRVTWETGPCW